MSGLDWRQHATCIGHDPELFFPEQGETAKRAEAQRICRSCPVQQQCCDHALATLEPWGVWGGMTERQRSTHLGIPKVVRMPVGRPPAPCGTPEAYRRHKRLGEPVDDRCKLANRAYEAARNRRRKAAAG